MHLNVIYAPTILQPQTSHVFKSKSHPDEISNYLNDIKSYNAHDITIAKCKLWTALDVSVNHAAKLSGNLTKRWSM